MSREEELPNEGLTVSFLERMDDVTERILQGWTENMCESERDSVVKASSEALISEATSGGNGLRATVESLYYGNRYYLFLYREYSDIRLVGAPPSAVGKFGGDTDNWMWPRHTGDFSIFRIYADKDGNPAPYSKENIPYCPKKFFKISLGGVQEGDFTFVYGFPGSTREYIMSEGVRYISEISDPHKIALRSERLAIQKKYMSGDQAIRIKYSSKNAGVANAWKKWQGEMKGIRRLGTVAAKQEYERKFGKWAEGSRYEGLTERLDSLYAALEPYNFAKEYYLETAYTIELVQFALKMEKLLKEYAAGEEGIEESIEKVSSSFYKDYYLPIDKGCFTAMMEAFGKNVPENFQPEYFKSMMREYGSAAEWADRLFGSSAFADSGNLGEIMATDTSVLASDPALVFGHEFMEWYKSDISPEYSRLDSDITLLYRDYMQGQMEFQPEKAFYPDANLTLRVAYGSVKGYSPADGIWYDPVSTLDGIIEKDNPEIFDYDIPQRLRDIYAAKDYGRWAEDGRIPVCFIADNHTSGGNSGSPVIDRYGNLVGINFDRVWEGTMSDIVFDPDYCRNIALDIRYVLFTIDKVAGAEHLLDEMVFVE